MMKRNSPRAIAASMSIHSMTLPFASHSTARARVPGWLLFAPLLVALLLAACSAPNPGAPAATQVNNAPRLTPARWADLPGWESDDLHEAWPAFRASCHVLSKQPAWSGVCARAESVADDSASLHRFFEDNFEPRRVENRQGVDTGLITGYYEPLLSGSRTRHPPYTVPLYGVPHDLIDVELSSEYPELSAMRLRGRLEGNKLVPYASRAEIEDWPVAREGAIVFVDDPIAALFMEVQGSGRIRLIDGDPAASVIRLSYADQNGHPYRAIGRWLVEHEELPLSAVSMQSITAWAHAHPERAREMLDSNPSYVFFKESAIADPALGPQGALGVALTPLRSLAVDGRVIPLGSPVFLSTHWPDGIEPLARLMMAQDTGGAIAASAERPVRADLFFGMGDAAAAWAGTMKQQGQLWVLVPIGKSTLP